MIICSESSSVAAEDTADSFLQGVVKFFSVFTSVVDPDRIRIRVGAETLSRIQIRKKSFRI
jgi:hypothetical protein